MSTTSPRRSGRGRRGAVGIGGVGAEEDERRRRPFRASDGPARSRPRPATASCPRAGTGTRRDGRAIVISFARRMRASSCASLMTRQPAVTGVALTQARGGQGGPDLVREREGHRLLDPDARRWPSRSRRMAATRADGLSCSSQARTSVPIWICSRARAFSKAGVTQAGSPSRVTTAPKKRSLRPHSAPVKYVEAGARREHDRVQVSRRASGPGRVRCGRGARRGVMGVTPSVIGRRASMAAGTSAGGEGDCASGRGAARARRRRSRSRDGGPRGGRASWRLWYPRPFMGRRAGWLLVTAFLLLAGPEAARAASFPPDLRFRSVSTDRVTVHFHQGLEQMARRAASPRHRDPAASRGALRRARRPREPRPRRRGGRPQRLRVSAALSAGAAPRGRSRRQRGLRQLRRLAAPRAHARAAARRPPRRGAGRDARRPARCWAAPLSSSRTPSPPPG